MYLTRWNTRNRSYGPTHPRRAQTNVDLIASDLAKGLYDQAYINFSSSVPRPVLQSFAERTLKGDAYAKIARVMDQYCEFVALEPRYVACVRACEGGRVRDARRRIWSYRASVV